MITYQTSHEADEFNQIFNKIGFGVALVKSNGHQAKFVLPKLEQAYNSIMNGHHNFHEGNLMPLAARAANWIQALIVACRTHPEAKFSYD